MIDAYVAFEEEPTELPDGRATFPVCYESYDAAMEEAQSTHDMLAVGYDLSACIRVAIDELGAAIAGQLVDNEAVADPATADENVKQAIEDYLYRAGAPATCWLVAEASEGGGGTIAQLYSSSCDNQVHVQLAEVLRGFVWSE